MINNKEALFLPFMQIPTGHHHVADALMHELQKVNRTIHCHKVDILSYSYGRMEGLISSTYLFCIKRIPQTYNWIYGRMAYNEVPKRNRQFLFEAMFTYFFKRLMRETEPTILFFTHCLPSHIASILKRNRKLNAVTVNVYTDYFVNRIWGVDGIDYHFVPSTVVKVFLMRNGVKEDKIFVTGIPVHAAFYEKTHEQSEKKEKEIAVLVTGGSLGVGEIDQFLPKGFSNKNLHYYVLCGKNERLYKKLVNRKDSNVTPIPYVENKEEMNRLYDKVDAVLTKPGGVTVSESLRKNKTIFIFNPLPGQEKINLEQLKQLGIVIPINMHEDTVENQIISYFSDGTRQQEYQKNSENYHRSLERKSMAKILETIIN